MVRVARQKRWGGRIGSYYTVVAPSITNMSLTVLSVAVKLRLYLHS